MSHPKRRLIVVLILLVVLVLIALLLGRCSRKPASTPPTTTDKPISASAGTPAPASNPAPEVLTAATVKVPESVPAGGHFKAEWTGPNNPGDYLTIVLPEAAAAAYQNYAETRRGNPLELTAPIEAGTYEVRYVATRSKTILGRAPIVIAATSATLTAPDEAGLGTTISVSWTGPNNPGDYVTVVPISFPDGRYGNYTETAKGSTLTLKMPVEAGPAELRYVTGQGARVLGRRPIKITTPDVSLAAPDRVEAGAMFNVSWTGPNNSGDYVTIVPKDMPDGRYANYLETAKGSTLALTALITPGDAELRYMTGQGARMLARRAIQIVAAKITLDARDEVVAGSVVSVTWTGPNNRGDYITIVPQTTPDGQYTRYADTSRGSPLNIESPIEAGANEVRYVSGQGSKVLARRPLKTLVPKVTLDGPATTTAGSTISVDWTGPKNPGDYLMVVLKSAKDGSWHHQASASRESPASLLIPPEAGSAEIRYYSGQGNRVLGRAPLEILAK
jgi:Ca-activated chloride channel family protein